jgi:hypothetical protein
MTSIIEAITDYANESFTYLKGKNFGFCELMFKSAKDTKGTLIGSSGSQPIPVTIPERKQVSLDDKYNFMTWIRWVEPARFDFNEQWSFGREEAEEGSLTLRIVLAHKTSLGENLVFTFARSIPRQFELSGYKYVFQNGRPQINPDHEGIYRTELGETSYEKHRFNWNLYTIDVTYNFIECIETTP